MLENEIQIKKDWKAPIACAFFLLLMTLMTIESTIIFLIICGNVSIFNIPAVTLPSLIQILLFLIFALISIWIGSVFFSVFAFGTERCNLAVFGFGFGTPGAIVISVISFLFGVIFPQFWLIAIVNVVSGLIGAVIGFVLWWFRHNVDFIIVMQFVKIDERIQDMDLSKVACPYGLLRLQRALERGIRARYLNQYLYLDMNHLRKSDVKIIDKKYLYENVHAPKVTLLVGVIACITCAFILVLELMSNNFALLIPFFFVFGIGVSLMDYYFIRTLNLRKTILILDHWLKRTGAVDLSRIDREFGFLPIKYPLNKLRQIARQYCDFLGARLVGNILQKDRSFLLSEKEHVFF
ncbi:MAG: hypothetical protein ACXQS8_05155 [Candidatus Helarchaeales archaeon]